METHNRNESDFALLQHDHYTVDELSKLVDMDHHLIERAVFNGQLNARIEGHQIVSITREDAIAWLRDRG